MKLVPTKKVLHHFQSWLLIGFGISISILISIGVYAAYTSLGVNSTDPLSASKWNELVSYTVPPNAIMAFSGTVCPANWTEYTPARGRFLRGIDSTGTNDTIRPMGDIQADAFQGHIHQTANILWGTTNGWNITGGWGQFYTWPLAYNTGWPMTDWSNGAPRTTTETRPKNVAVLYCIKN